MRLRSLAVSARERRGTQRRVPELAQLLRQHLIFVALVVLEVGGQIIDLALEVAFLDLGFQELLGDSAVAGDRP